MQSKTNIVEFSAANAVIDYNVTNNAIVELQKKYTDLKASDKEGYKTVTKALSEVRTLRTSVEKKRKEYKADSLEYGRKIDAEAERVTNLLLNIENPLKTEKENYDNEQARIKAEQERLERERISDILDRIDRIKNAPFKHQGKTVEELEAVIKGFYETILYDAFDYGEFCTQALNAKRLTDDQFQEMLKQKKEAEALAEERRKFEEEKAQLAALKLPIIDGAQTKVGNRVYIPLESNTVKDSPSQTAPAQNGIYTVTTADNLIAKFGIKLIGEHITKEQIDNQFNIPAQQTKAFTAMQRIIGTDDYPATYDSGKPTYNALINILEELLKSFGCNSSEDYHLLDRANKILKSAKGE